MNSNVIETSDDSYLSLNLVFVKAFMREVVIEEDKTVLDLIKHTTKTT
jgi:hypothetical protein